MKITLVTRFALAGALCAAALPVRSQVIELRATINQAQENPPTGATATGSAIMLYDVGANTFDLVVAIDGMTNPATASHLHEAAAGANGAVVTTLGGESAYVRTGTSLRATFRNLTHGGDKLKLLQGGAYFNIHSAQFPGGEIRGQLLPRPVRLYATMTVAQEAAAMPAQNFSTLNDFGGAVMVYDPASNRLSLRSSVYNFANTLNNSHFHEGAVGVSGGVVHNLGNNANAGIYANTSGAIQGSFDGPYLGDPVKLLTGGAYLNYHSTTFGGGELRGQVYVASEVPGTRYINLSVRGFVGAGEQALISGIVVNGTEPVRTLITAKGPSLTAYGVAGVLANPKLELYDSAGRRIAVNDDVGPVAAGSELASLPGVPGNPLESALVIVLPPGNYTAIVTASTAGTGVAILEVNDLRTLGVSITTVAALNRASPVRAASLASVAEGGVELCRAPIVATLARR